MRKKRTLQERRIRPLFLAVSAASAFCLQISGRAMGATETWTAGSGDWSTAANWTQNVTPNNNGSNLYDVTISGGTVSLDINPTIQQLDLSGGSLSGASTTLTLNDVFNWTGGTVGSAASGQTIHAR